MRAVLHVAAAVDTVDVDGPIDATVATEIDEKEKSERVSFFHLQQDLCPDAAAYD